MTLPDITLWSNDNGSFTVARNRDQQELGRYRDDDPDGWRAYLGTSDDNARFLGEYEDDGDCIAAIVEAAQEAGLV